MKKKFLTIHAQLGQLKAKRSQISDPDEDEQLHFQVGGDNFQFMQLNQVFEPNIAKLFNQATKPETKLNLHEVILLDSQSTMDLVCNCSLVERMFKASSKMHLHSNRGTMVVSHKAKVKGYKNNVWFSSQGSHH